MKNVIKKLIGYTSMLLLLSFCILGCSHDIKNAETSDTKDNIKINTTYSSSITSNDIMTVKLNKNKTKLFFQFKPSSNSNIDSSHYAEGRVFYVNVNDSLVEFDGKSIIEGSLYGEMIGDYFEMDLPDNSTTINVEYLNVFVKIFTFSIGDGASGNIKISSDDINYGTKTLTLTWNDILYYKPTTASSFKASIYYNMPFPENNPQVYVETKIENGLTICEGGHEYDLSFHLCLNDSYEKFKGIGPHELIIKNN